MKILMAGSPSPGIGWWRQIIPSRALRQAGHQVETLQLRNDAETAEAMTRVVAQTIDGMGGVDLVWTGDYRGLGAALGRFCDRFNIPFYLDIDDLIDAVPFYNPAFGSSKTPVSPLRRKVGAILPFASGLTVSTSFLRDHYVREHGDAIPVYLCPNMVDPEWWRNDVGEIGDPHGVRLPVPRVGLGVNLNRYGDYQPLLPMLRAHCDRGDLQVYQMGEPLPEFWGAPLGNVVWQKRQKGSIGIFHRLLGMARLDILINRLEVNDFNLAKSNIKWLEAAMAGTVLMTTRFGEMDLPRNTALFLAPQDGVEEWERVMIEYLNDRDRLTEIAVTGQAEVLRNWTIQAKGGMWEEAVNALSRQEADTRK